MDAENYGDLVNTVEDILDSKGYQNLKLAILKVLYPDKFIEELDVVVCYDKNDGQAHLIDENSKWISTKPTNTMRMDHPRHGGGGQTHVHIFGKKGKLLGVVNLDGTGSHGTKMRLTKDQAGILTAHGVTVRKDRIIEWIVLKDSTLELLLE
ncbi:MAG TPA: hypothetical protein VIJ49_01120 [Aestuariivirga sp.]